MSCRMHGKGVKAIAPRTVAIKCEVLQRAGIDAVGVALVTADFEQEDWTRRLADAGFDVNPALFLWEGVTPCLDKAAVKETLRTIAGTAKGSVAAFDYLTTEVLESRPWVPNTWIRTGSARQRRYDASARRRSASAPPTCSKMVGSLIIPSRSPAAAV